MRSSTNDLIDFSQGYSSPTMVYSRFLVQGYLLKEFREKKVYHLRTNNKRWFVLDHTAMKMRIHKSSDLHSQFKTVKYAEI